MKPKKNSSIDYILYAIFLIVVIYIAAQLACCRETVDELVKNGTMEAGNEFMETLKLLSDKINTAPYKLGWSAIYSEQYLLYGFLSWIITLAAIESKKKNYIHGKEYGTARWGKISDIRALFSENIAKAEIRKINKRKNPIYRFFLKSEIIRKCKEEGKSIEKLLLAEAKIQQDELDGYMLNGVDITKYPRPKSDKEIKEEVKALVDENIKKEWEPVLYKEQYEERLAQIKESPLYVDDDERDKQNALAKKEYKEKRLRFYKAQGEKNRITAKYHNMDVLLTETERISMLNLQSLNNNQLIIGGSGSGKSRGYVMPNLLQAHSSYVFTDPKGELLEKGGYFLEKRKGYKVFALDTVDMARSACFNPFHYLHPERPGYDARVMKLVDTLVLNTDGGKMKDPPDPFWPKAEKMFFQSLIYAIPKAFVEEYQTFDTMLELISMLEIKPDGIDQRDSDLDIFFENYKERIGNDFAYQTYNEFRTKAPDKTGNSVLMSVNARIQPFRGEEVKRILSTDDMHLERIGEEKTAIFVIVPPTDQTFSFIPGMLFTVLFDEIQYCASVVHKHDGQKLPIPVRLILDEFRNTCRIPHFIELLAYARSFGVGISVILQSLDQLKELYEKEWGVILDNCSSKLFLGGISHMDTLKYISDLLGKGTYDKKTTGRTRGRQGSSSTNDDVIGRSLLEPDEIQRMPKEDCLLFVTGKPAFYSKKYRYEKHPNYCFTSDSNKSYSYEHHPIEHEIPHREEEQVETIENKLKPDFMKINEKAGIVFKDIEFEVDQIAAVKRLGKHLNEYEIIPDDELFVDDGETTDSDYIEPFEQLLEEDDSFKLTQIEDAKKEDDSKEPTNKEINILNSLSFIIKNISNWEVIPDDELFVEDGETSQDDINEEYEKAFDDTEIFMDDEVDQVDLENSLKELEEEMDMDTLDKLSSLDTDEVDESA